MHARVTALEALQGCLLALACAVLLVVLHTAFRGLRRVTSPAFAVLEMLPLVASVPLFFIWFGFGNGPAIATAFLLCFPALASCLQSGTDQAPRELLEILEAAGIPTAKTFWKIQLPACLPFLSIGLKRCIPLALAGATVAEFVASNSGLGSRMLFAASRTETTPLFASLTVLIIMACGSYGLLLLIERGIIGWLGPGADWKKWGGTRHPNQRSASNDE
jgi:NitT/TauT family transport system permease protein